MQINHNRKSIIRKIITFLLLTGLLISTTEFIYGIISKSTYVRSIINYTALCALSLAISKFKLFSKLWIQLLVAILITLLNWAYIQFIYRADLFIIVVPQNYTGKISIKMNDPHSLKRINPIDKKVFFEVDPKGRLDICSNYKVPFNSIIVASMVNGQIRPEVNHLKLEDMNINEVTIENQKYYIFSANVTTVRK